MTSEAAGTAQRSITLTIDGQAVCVPEGTTLLEACRLQGIATPTLCYLENLKPVNVCRVCVVEVEGSRALVPACSRRAENGMVVQTDSERVRLSRRLVLESLPRPWISLWRLPSHPIWSAMTPAQSASEHRQPAVVPATHASLATMRHQWAAAQKPWPSR
jgi:ferredoxin